MTRNYAVAAGGAFGARLGRIVELLDDHQIIGGGPTAHVGDQFILDLLAFPQRLQARFLDSRDVNEGVLFPTLLLDETVTLPGVEPLYRSNWHVSAHFPRSSAYSALHQAEGIT